MIIWLNGAFGSGKTQTAYELHRRLEGSYIYDPENAGYFIQKNIPLEIGEEDFQDYPMWRGFSFEMLDYMTSRYQGDIIVPMTITNREYFDQIVGELSKKHEVKHFILCATKETLLKRLASRFENSKSWGARQIDRCLAAFDKDITECKIYTDSLNVYEVVDKVAEMSGIALLEDNRNSFRKKMDRLIIMCKHIR